ncbi:reverse transcriptase [Cucumis melo var. makuwa]|uniref:Reverse transcriptase n=1 Tax=Cucumis melo var. makuwa TaxID=1194695 RepID=A0A5A7USX3_CUCMM|nr:reverse transcriptase [Cucumis melo var. makuwa]
MLYLAKVPDSVRFLESRFEEIAEKTDTIDTVASRVEGLPIQELLARVDTLEGNVGRTVNYEYGDSSSGFVGHMEEHVKKATNTVTEEAKVTLATMHLSEDAKLVEVPFFPENGEILARRKLCELKHTDRLKPWAKTKLYEQRVQDLTSTYAATERLSDLISDSQDVRRHQSSSPQRNRNSRSSSSKAVGGDKHSGKNRRPYQSNTENTWQRSNNRSPLKRPLSCFICEGPHLARECPNKVNFHAFQASLISDSDDKSNQVEVRMEFLLEHQVIPMPLAKCLVITGSFPTVVQADIRQPNGFKMISAMQLDKSPIQEEPPSATILLGALGKLGGDNP